MNHTDKKIVLGLDIPKSARQINADIKKLQKQLAKIQVAGALDTSSGVKAINAEIAALEAQLKSVDADKQTPHTAEKSLFQSLSESVRKFVSGINATAIFSKITAASRQALLTVKDLDSALLNLKKTSDMSARELINFYRSANDTAKQMGVSTRSVIEQAAAWSRLGFRSSEAAAQMAALSSQFQLISPGMASEEAVSGLISIMKAYGIEADDVLDSIMSKINITGNTFSLNNADIIAMLQSSAAAMAEGNNTLEETIALETAAFEIMQDRNVGDGFKAAALRIRGINEETRELDDSLRTMKSDFYELTGISVMQDDGSYKSTFRILKEMSDVRDSLTSQAQTEALALMFGSQWASVGASTLENFSAAEKVLDDMAHSAGNAEAEMAAAMDSIEYKLNKVKETGTGIAQNLFAREDAKSALDIIGALGNGLDWLTEKLGLLGSIGVGAGLFAGIKNTGKRRISVRIS